MLYVVGCNNYYDAQATIVSMSLPMLLFAFIPGATIYNDAQVKPTQVRPGAYRHIIIIFFTTVQYVFSIQNNGKFQLG